VKYLAFPILIGVVAGLGSAIRFYRAVFLEEMEQDYVRTARAKGVSGTDILFIHVLRNAGIPIITRLSVVIPFLITGSLLIERLFELPGLGDLMLSGIQARDFWVVMPLTYLLAVVYSLTVLATDIAYAFIDPRVRVH
jgi:peptide/nickel transport system permease protein